jgi:hypothetical protein
MAWISVTGWIVGLVSFIFALWERMKSGTTIHQLTTALRSIHKISGDVLWEMVKLKSGATESRLRHAERALGLVGGIYRITKEQLERPPGYRHKDTSQYGPSELETLIEKRVLYTQSMINDIESSATTRDVWLVTPDLEPDLSEKETGKLVGDNVRKGKKYVYFVPADLTHLSDLKLRLKSNLGIDAKSRLDERVILVQIDAQEFWLSLGPGNVIFFFDKDPKSSRGHAFKELVFTQISDRGMFWQECVDAEAESLYRFLREKLGKQHT